MKSKTKTKVQILQEENTILKLKLADAEIKQEQLKKELDTVIELYQILASKVEKYVMEKKQ